MAKKLMAWKTKGMNQDTSVSAFSPEFSFENRNLRLSTNENNTQFSWVNEKGTEYIPIYVEVWRREDMSDMEGPYTDEFAKTLPLPSGRTEPYTGIEDAEEDGWSWPQLDAQSVINRHPFIIGTAVINHQLIGFFAVYDNNNIHISDTICKYYWKKNKLIKVTLYSGNLHFSKKHPLETLVSYESETVQKVYWTDGVNQPRLINVADDLKHVSKYTDTSFDFIPTLKLKEEVKIKKDFSGGMFPPGVIQYAFTYYNKYGAESNIFYTSPLLYVSYSDRGASPEDKVADSFKITIDHVDTDFDYLRIYSIQRTSVNGTPIVKRVQDILISDAELIDPDFDPEDENYTDEDTSNNFYRITYIDTGLNGDSVDPAELLYKGGETIVAQTMEQKDGTLFFGNIEQKRSDIDANLRSSIAGNVAITTSYRYIKPLPVSQGAYTYYNQLTSTNLQGDNTLTCSTFKRGNYYRLGVQFQHETGKWSEPIYVGNTQMDYSQYPAEGTYDDENQFFTETAGGDVLRLSTFIGTLSHNKIASLKGLGYKKVRPLVVLPTVSDRKVLCQGVSNPTLKKGSDTWQASWFFRSYHDRTGQQLIDTDNDYVEPQASGYLRTFDQNIKHEGAIIPDNPAILPTCEIQGNFDSDLYEIDREFRTLHSPDIEFDTQLQVFDFTDSKCGRVGYATVTYTMSDIDIQTSTPTIGNGGNGFIKNEFSRAGTKGLISGRFYEDCAVDEKDEYDYPFAPDERDKYYRWMVYLWNKSGSLNNDVNRPANHGNQTAVLKKKIISNLRYANTYFETEVDPENPVVPINTPKLFQSDEVTILKWNNKYYQGNIDTLLIPTLADGCYFYGKAVTNVSYEWCTDNSYSSCQINRDPEHSFIHVVGGTEADTWQKTYSFSPDDSVQYGLYYYQCLEEPETHYDWHLWQPTVGNHYVDLVMKKEGVRIKYKSTPHIVLGWKLSDTQLYEPEPTESVTNQLSIIELWQNIDSETIYGGDSMDALKANHWIPCGEPVSLGNGSSDVTFEYSYGDTYYQRYDCLKTYPFTREDVNQVVEIGSFMLETYVNIDGRYDRNRGQQNNLNVSPINFNLINPVYSQVDNFFTYRITDDYNDSLDDIKKYPNQITWSKTKTSGADVDMWTNVTLASTMELDGDKGQITSLKRLNDQIIAFQDRSISQILYNENVQIASTAGVPIEIANSQKVQGKRYLTNTVGCSNKWSIVNTPGGLYFMDSNNKDIYLFNGQLSNITQKAGFNTWAKKIPAPDVQWNPVDFKNFVSYYDYLNQDVLFISENDALAFSEKTGTFTSFYDYGNTPYFVSMDDKELWIRKNGSIYAHQAGDYNNFFGVCYPYWMQLVGNPEPTTDKIFTNIEFRACVDNEGRYIEDKYTPYLPFDSLRTWNEYQEGEAKISNKNGFSLYKHHERVGDVEDNALIRKFRIWRCDIPRDKIHKQDRMRNPWLYLKFTKKVGEGEIKLPRVEIHDMVMTYFN